MSPSAIILFMSTLSRIFKTAWFAKAARKAGIEDAVLREAVQQAMRGQAVDLGGGVFKKRLNRNEHRAIILARRGDCWVFQYMFAKKDRANISKAELLGFRELATMYSNMPTERIEQLINDGDWVELS